MQLSYAVLLDGGFLRHKLGTSKKPVDAPGICAFANQIAAMPCLRDTRLHRIYFYDAKPLEGVCAKPLDGGTIDFSASAMAARNKRVHAALIREPFFALRFGELVHEGWRLRSQVLQRCGPRTEIGAEDIEPNIRQKCVDMCIGLDIASLTLKQHVKIIVLVTADCDFIPAMKFARREGAQLFLVTLGHGIREGLREHADLVIDEYPLPCATLVRSVALV
jgi:uncharacterized LabA/DUF88 family protein